MATMDVDETVLTLIGSGQADTATQQQVQSWQLLWRPLSGPDFL